MTAMLRIAGDGGVCCECGDVDGCDCHKCSKLECRSRGGTVQLCGFPENQGHVSTPPRFYLQKAIGGFSNVCTCSNLGCDNVDLEGPLTCFIDKTNPSGCRYQGRGEIIDIFDAGGGTYKYNVKCDFSGGTPGGSPCGEVGARGIYVGGGYFYFSDSNGGATATVEAAGGSVCSPSGASTRFASVSIEIDIPGVGGTTTASASRYVRTDIPIISRMVSYEGAITYDPAISCAVPVSDDMQRISSETTSLLCRETHGPSPTTISVDSAFEVGDTFLDGYLTKKDVTATSITQHSPSACPDTPGSAARPGSQRWEDLRNEDTEEDALLRLLSGPAGVWSGWQIVLDGSGETCENPECCRAAWQIRTDRTFEYREAEWRATIEGLNPGDAVTIKIKVYRKAYGPGGTWALFEELEYDVTATGPEEPPFSAQAQATGTTPNAEGFETYVACSYSPAVPP